MLIHLSGTFVCVEQLPATQFEPYLHWIPGFLCRDLEEEVVQVDQR